MIDQPTPSKEPEPFPPDNSTDAINPYHNMHKDNAIGVRRVSEGELIGETSTGSNRMEIDSPRGSTTAGDGERGESSGLGLDVEASRYEKTGNRGGWLPEKKKEVKAFEVRKIQFEATTAWYKRLTQSGGGWEHIFVGSYDQVSKIIGVEKL